MPIFLVAIFFQSLVYFCSAHIKCSEEKVLICGVIKNGEKGFGNVKKCAEELGNLFADYRVIVYENNSIDATKNLYKGWAHNNQKVIFISEDLTQDFLDNYTVKIGDYRTQFIARARNIVLEKALSCEFDDYAYHIMADLDAFEPWAIDEIKNTVENPQKEWDAVCANGSYDTYALENDTFRLNHLLLGKIWARECGAIREKLSKILSNGFWYKVESAFGGIAIYKRSSIKGCRYKGLITSEYVDHILESKIAMNWLLKRLSKNDKLKIKTNLKNLMNWKSSNYDPSFELDIYYVCEHVQFHLNMARNGYAKIFINPKLKSVTYDHSN